MRFSGALQPSNHTASTEDAVYRVKKCVWIDGSPYFLMEKGGVEKYQYIEAPPQANKLLADYLIASLVYSSG